MPPWCDVCQRFWRTDEQLHLHDQPDPPEPPPLKNYIIMEFIPGTGLLFHDSFEMKKEAEAEISKMIKDGVDEKSLVLIVDIPWSVTVDKQPFSRKKGEPYAGYR